MGNPAAPALPFGRSPLLWLGDLLCPPGSGLRFVVGPARGEPQIAEWLMFPPTERPRLLAPVRGSAARSAFAQFNDSMTQVARLRKAAVGTALRFGGGITPRSRMVSIVGRTDDPRLDLFGSVLPERFGEHVVTAVMLGGELRPNTKPVIQIMRRDGAVLAYAKVGWNRLTHDLVANESAALASWAAASPTSFVVPRSLGLMTWNGLSILLVSPVPHHVMRRGRRDAPAPTEVIREVVAHGETGSGPLGDAPYPARLINEASGVADDRIRTVARSAIDRVVDRVGDRSIQWGTAHGDLGPWNMSRTREGMHVWDWERTAGAVPAGCDVLHFFFQTRALRSSGRVDRAASDALEAAAPQLRELGVDPSVHSALMHLYLIEILLRLEAGRASGVPVRERLLAGLLQVLSGDERRP